MIQPERTRHPKDPRRNPRWRPRGPKRWAYSWAELARLFGVKVATVKKWVWEQKKFDPADLGSVVRFWLSRRQR